MALALHQQHIPCKIYESRSPDAPELASGVVLTPNGLRVLDALGVFERIKDRCWKSEYRTYKDDKDETTKKILIANEQLYGYKNHRIWRRLLLAEMKLMLRERDVSITYNARFGGITEDNGAIVAFRVNSSTERAAMLIGADGIFSSVRKYVAPNVEPEYTGVIGNLAHIQRDKVNWPYPDYEPACTIQGKPGALFMIPEDPQAREIMVGMQIQCPESNRAEWNSLAADKDKLCDFFRKGYGEWHDTARQIIDRVCEEKENIYLWPFLRMPKLERWYSASGRVVLLGDGAHAIPASSGQGVNQALEDVHALILLLKGNSNLPEALSIWQRMRQQRIDAVFDWATNATNVMRMPEAERNRLIQEGKFKDPKSNEDFDDMRWLYSFDCEKEVAALTKV